MVTVTVIIKVLVILLLISLIALVINLIEAKHKNKKVAIPFKESMDLLSVPVVTFMNEDTKLHFLLDTGGDYSYIDKSVLSVIDIKDKNDNSINIVTGSGSATSEGMVTFKFSYKKHIFEETFVVQDLKDQLAAAFSPYGVIVHGVLGSAFFSKYKYEINYEDLTAYSK